jgi:hypothetical protein
MAGPQISQVQSPDELANLIRTAMARRYPVAAIYEGRQRLLCPHMLGRNKGGRLRVLCYQYGGESESGLQRKDGHGDWRCFSVEKISHLRVLEAPWQGAESFPGRPTCIDEIEMAVDDQPDDDPQKGQ